MQILLILVLMFAVLPLWRILFIIVAIFLIKTINK